MTVPDLIESAKAKLLQTTISGKRWAKEQGPGQWRSAWADLDEAIRQSQPPPPPPAAIYPSTATYPHEP